MLGTYIVIAQAAGFFKSKFKDLLRAGGKVDLAAVVLAGASKAFDDLFHARGFKPQFAQDPGGYAALFADQTEQQVLGTNVIVAHALGLMVGEAEHASCSLSEAIHSSQGLSPFADRHSPATIGILPKSLLRFVNGKNLANF
jgi:hypothetical protein